MDGQREGRDRSPGQAPPGTATPRGRLTVLIVDADAQRAHLLAAALQPGCLVALASTARVAGTIIAQRCPDLIITDLDLPDESGVDFIGRVHASSATGHVLVMVVTRRANVRDKIAALRAGADEYLVWPCDPDLVAQRVKLLSKLRRTI
jgi:DNA-binding response OmpR family regulator